MTERIAGLAERYALSAGAAEQLEALLGVLTADPAAPTSVRDPDRALDEHLADSLVALELPEVRSAQAIADLGAGAGLPGLPLAIALPDASVLLVESNGRKCVFIDRAAAACRLRNAAAVCARAESWPDGIGRFDLVTARALAPLEVIAEYAAPLLTIGGAAVFWRGRRDPEAELAAARAAAILGLDPAPPLKVAPFAGAEHRHLHVMVKVAETPARFPRRAGVANKRPLGAA